MNRFKGYIYDRFDNVHESRLIIFENKKSLLEHTKKVEGLLIDNGGDEFAKNSEAQAYLRSLQSEIDGKLYKAILEVVNAYQYAGFMIANKLVDKNIILKEEAETIRDVYKLVGFIVLLESILFERKKSREHFVSLANEAIKYLEMK